MITVYNSIDSIPNSIKLIRDNDVYFDAKSKLLNTDLVKKILKKIEDAEYVSEDVFIGRNRKIGGLYKENLSTGIKTLINIINHEDVCFDVIECGDNVLELIPTLSCKVNGVILWKHCMYPFENNYKCEIQFNGKKINRAFDFTTEVVNGEDGNEEWWEGI